MVVDTLPDPDELAFAGSVVYSLSVSAESRLFPLHPDDRTPD